MTENLKEVDFIHLDMKTLPKSIKRIALKFTCPQCKEGMPLQNLKKVFSLHDDFGYVLLVCSRDCARCLYFDCLEPPGQIDFAKNLNNDSLLHHDAVATQIIRSAQNER